MEVKMIKFLLIQLFLNMNNNKLRNWQKEKQPPNKKKLKPLKKNKNK